ncbi:MAG: hypothetical protein HYU66_13870, partial [Armatimonadetes bacterium]|nr:hypothetical protein [Armatimonadota bacterium]
MRHRTCLVLLLATAALGAHLDVNGSFERTAAVAPRFIAEAEKAKVAVSPRLPQLWQINYGMLSGRGGSSIQLVDDPARARTGRCALELKPAEVFLPGLPVKPGSQVRIHFFATGPAAVMLGAWLSSGKAQNLYPPPVAAGKADEKGYVEYTETALVPDDALVLSFSLGADGLVDDLSIDVDGLAIVAPDLAEPVADAADTLALATGDAPLVAGSACTAKLIDGLFGKAWQVGPEELLQVPGRYRELLGGGTLELWLRPHWEGADEQNHPLIDLSSDGFGLGLMRDQYNHVSFYGSDGWTNGTGIVLSQHWMFGNRWG